MLTMWGQSGGKVGAKWGRDLVRRVSTQWGHLTQSLLAPALSAPAVPLTFASRPAPDLHRLVIRAPLPERHCGAKGIAATRAPAPAAAVAD